MGPATGQVVTAILESKRHPEMGYRACLGIMSLARSYSAARLEAASQRALLLGAYSYQNLKSILKRSLDQQPVLAPDIEKSGPHHDNVRGAQYYDAPPNPLLQ